MPTVTTHRYIRKPLYVDAVHVSEDNFVEVSKWCQGEVRLRDHEELVDVAELDDPSVPHECFIRVRVHNPKNPRQTKAFVGDWILYTEKGYKVYTQKAFRNSFDPVDGNDSDNT
jgi:hypothetical protein